MDTVTATREIFAHIAACSSHRAICDDHITFGIDAAAGIVRSGTRYVTHGGQCTIAANRQVSFLGINTTAVTVVI